MPIMGIKQRPVTEKKARAATEPTAREAQAQYAFETLAAPTASTPAPIAASSVADALFTQTQQRVLALLYGQSDRSFFANEIISLAGSGSGAVQRELARLESSGLVTVQRIGNQKHFQANRESFIFEPLRKIVLRTVGLSIPLQEALTPLASRIQCAFVYGSVAKQEDTSASDIDMVVVSDNLTYGEVFAALEGAATALGRPVNPSLYYRADIQKRLREQHAFITRVLAQPTIWLIGSEHDLGL